MLTPRSNPAAFYRRADRLKKTIAEALIYGANEYANGNDRARPIVDQHFTPGNAERYHWPPLSAAYFKAKQRGIVKHAGGHYFLDPSQHRQLAQRKAAEKTGDHALGGHYANGGAKGFLAAATAGRMGSKLDQGARYFAHASKEGAAAGIAGSEGGGANLPMLVLTSALRTAVNSRQHHVALMANGAAVRITFAGLPEYAKYLQEGDGTPMRSPVNPNELDREQVIAAMVRYMDRALGRSSRAGGVSAAPAA